MPRQAPTGVPERGSPCPVGRVATDHRTSSPRRATGKEFGNVGRTCRREPPLRLLGRTALAPRVVLELAVLDLAGVPSLRSSLRFLLLFGAFIRQESDLLHQLPGWRLSPFLERLVQRERDPSRQFPLAAVLGLGGPGLRRRVEFDRDLLLQQMDGGEQGALGGAIALGGES